MHGEYRGCKGYDYKQCKRHLKRYINQVIDSKEFDEFLEKYCECRYCNEDFHYCMYHCLHRCYHEFEYLLHNRFKELRKEPRYELKKIEPYVLVDSLYFYFNQNGITDNPTLMHFMVGGSSKDLSSILDSLNREKYPKLATMLFLGHSAATAVNAGKVAFTENPMAINYPQWIAFTKYSYSQLKWAVMEKPTIRDAYVTGKIYEEMNAVFAEVDNTFEEYTRDKIVIYS